MQNAGLLVKDEVLTAVGSNLGGENVNNYSEITCGAGVPDPKLNAWTTLEAGTDKGES